MQNPKVLVPVALFVGLGACNPAPEAVGKRLYMDNCTACHGATGQGDGPLAAQLDTPVPDLTLIAQRNGGTFPMTYVLDTVDGYTRARAGRSIMPEFGADLQAGPLIYLDTGDGIRTPTPSRLFALAEYLRSIQR